MSSMHDDFRPTARLETLKQRASIIAAIRRFFDARDFVEVETPVLSHDTVVDRFLDPVVVRRLAAVGDSLGRGTKADGDCAESTGAKEACLYLQTSPEFAMKRLVAAGMPRIYQLAHAFRRDELGEHHNIEFCMLEWYECGTSYASARDFLGQFLMAFFPERKVRDLTYQQVFIDVVGWDPLTASETELRQQVVDRGGERALANRCDRDELLNWLFASVVQPGLGLNSIDLVCDWPASQSALAQVREIESGARVAERFEAFVDGEELANGYHELLDADELRLRSRMNNAARVLEGREALPESSRLEQAMRAGLPDCCGVALGVDRLVMKLLGAETISDVIAFPFSRA